MDTLLPRGRLKCSARAVQLFGRLAVVETHTLWYQGDPYYLITRILVLLLHRIWHFWGFTHSPPHFHQFSLAACSTFEVDFSPLWRPSMWELCISLC